MAGDEPHPLRVTSQGRIQNYVDFALDYFQKHSDGCIALHTLPPPTDPTNPPVKNRSSECIPKLISVVEIIKRAYMDSLKPALDQELHGLHQYNELASLDEPAVDPEQERQTQILLALAGKNHPQIRKSAYMRIYLSREERPDLARATVTYQHPGVKRLTKSAKRRAKRGSQKQADQMDAAPTS